MAVSQRTGTLQQYGDDQKLVQGLGALRPHAPPSLDHRVEDGVGPGHWQDASEVRAAARLATWRQVRLAWDRQDCGTIP